MGSYKCEWCSKTLTDSFNTGYEKYGKYRFCNKKCLNEYFDRYPEDKEEIIKTRKENKGFINGFIILIILFLIFCYLGINGFF
jgi:hypothetical protein